MFLGQTLISFSDEPQQGSCCQYTRVSSEITDSCCVLVTVSNPYCLTPSCHILIQKYNNQTNEFITEYVETSSRNFTTKLCPENGETSLVYRIRIAFYQNHNEPYCAPLEWTEGLNQFTDTVSLDNCCDCPGGKQEWLLYSLYKSRDCPDNGCKLNLLDLDIPSENSCYTNYQLKWNDGTPISSMMSIANDPIYTISKCIPNETSLILKVYLYKNGESDLDSACMITKIFQCRDDIPSIDTTENVCTPDCFNDGWETPQWITLEVPENSGCQVDVLYTHRTACSPTNYQDLQVLQISTAGCHISLTNKELYQQTVIGLIKLNPMGFLPTLVDPGCDTTWRIIKTDCWRNLYELSPPSDTHPYWQINFVLQQCLTGDCCIQKYTVCRDSAGNLSITPTEYIASMNPESCVYVEEIPLPNIGPFGEIIGPLFPDICYSSCDWVTINYPQLSPGKISMQNIEFTKLSGNKLRIDCSNNSSCKIRIDYYDLLGNYIYSTNKTISGTDNEIDITSYIKQNGIFIYRIYLNDNLYKTGKFIK